MIQVQRFEGTEELSEDYYDVVRFVVMSLILIKPGLKVVATKGLSGHVSSITPAVLYVVPRLVAVLAKPETWRPGWSPALHGCL